MATMNNIQQANFIAGADLRTRQYHFVALSAGRVVLPADGGDAVGVLLNAPNTGESAQVAIGGIVKVRADATFAIDVNLTSSADGQARLATTGNRVLARALEPATAVTQIVEVFLRTQGQPNAA